MPHRRHRPLADLVLVAFDTETTGLSARQGRLVEIAGVKFNLHGEVLGSFTSLINPGIPIPPEVVRIHGINNAAVRDAPRAPEALREFFRFVGDAETLLTAHNASFDIGFLREEFLRHELPVPEHVVLDTLRLARSHYPSLSNHQLGTVARALGLTIEMQHRAFADSMLVRGIAARILNGYPAGATLAAVRGGQLLHIAVSEQPAQITEVRPVGRPRRRAAPTASGGAAPPAP